MDLYHQFGVENFSEEEVGYIYINNQYEAEFEEVLTKKNGFKTV